jgi:hypothetical protein
MKEDMMTLHKLRIALAAILVAAAAVTAVDAAFALQVPEQEVTRDRRAVDSASASLRYQDHTLFFWDSGP